MSTPQGDASCTTSPDGCGRSIAASPARACARRCRSCRRSCPDSSIHEVPSGTEVFDWTVPDEWAIRGARLDGPDGEVVVDFADSNLHVVGYSIPVDSGADPRRAAAAPALDPGAAGRHPLRHQLLQPHVGLLPRRRGAQGLSPTAPTARDRQHPRARQPHLRRAGHSRGGRRTRSSSTTYVCHPSMANNELSGPVVAAALAQWLDALPRRHYTYRFVFTPRDHRSHHLRRSQPRPAARRTSSPASTSRASATTGAYTYLASRTGHTRIDRIAKRVLTTRDNVVEYSYLGRGSDERSTARLASTCPSSR